MMAPTIHNFHMKIHTHTISVASHSNSTRAGYHFQHWVRSSTDYFCVKHWDNTTKPSIYARCRIKSHRDPFSSLGVGLVHDVNGDLDSATSPSLPIGLVFSLVAGSGGLLVLLGKYVLYSCSSMMQTRFGWEWRKA